MQRWVDAGLVRPRTNGKPAGDILGPLLTSLGRKKK